MSAEKNAVIDSASKSAVQLSLMEIGLGSFLHAFRIPFSGFFLSLNQCFLLNRAIHSAHSSPFLPMTISNTAAIVKTLSPYGKKFTPMLAISMQGLLFNMGTLIFGNNLIGRCMGSLLLSLWPMLQPALIYSMIYGALVFDLATFYNKMLSQIPFLEGMTLQAILSGYVFIHLSLTMGVCLLSFFLPEKFLESYDRLMISCSSFKPKSPEQQNSFLQKLRGAFKDLTSPIFLLSLLLSALFFYATQHSLESFFFAFFRLIAVAFLTFFLLRNISSEWCIHIFSKFCFLNKYTPYVEEVLHHIQSKRE